MFLWYILFLQLSSFLIDQKCSVCIDGRRFSIQILLKDLGLKRYKLASTFPFRCLFLELDNIVPVVCVFCRRMIKSLNWWQDMDPQNGLSLQSLCLVELENNAERGNE